MAITRRLAPVALLLAAASMHTPALAQDEAPQLTIELNRVEARENACQLVFVTQNGTEAGVEQLVLEVVLFDRAGGVAALTLLDFQDLPAGRMRVRSFDMPGLQCEGLGRLLVNATAGCAPQGAPGCNAMALSSRVDDIEVLQ